MNKNNFTISNDDIVKIKKYIEQTNDTTSNLKDSNDINVILDKYEEDLKNQFGCSAGRDGGSRNLRNSHRGFGGFDQPEPDLVLRPAGSGDCFRYLLRHLRYDSEPRGSQGDAPFVRLDRRSGTGILFHRCQPRHRDPGFRQRRRLPSHSDGDRRLRYHRNLCRNDRGSRCRSLFGGCEIIQIREE